MALAGWGAAGIGAITGEGEGMDIGTGGAATGAAGLLNCGGITTGAGADGRGMA